MTEPLPQYIFRGITMLDRWDLSLIYTGLDSPEFKADTERAGALMAELNKLAAGAAGMDHALLIKNFLAIENELNLKAGRLMQYCGLRYEADTNDSAAQSTMGVLMAKFSTVAAAEASIKNVIGGFEDLPELIAVDEELGEFSYYLNKLHENRRYLLSDKEEAMFAKLNISGAGAWEDLQGSLTSSVKANYRGESITLSEVRNLAYDADPSVRKDAYDAEIACYDSVKTAVAFSLNSIKLQVINECEMRGYESPLDKALKDSRMSRATLDALWAAIEDYLPKFWEYMKVKAKALGYECSLKWWDLFAPMGSSGRKYTAEEAGEILTGIFSKVDPDICSIISRAFNENWIDFFPREGKVGGAFDSGVAAIGQSRVLTNFDGAFSDIVTLAHELGHAFHDSRVFCHKPLNQDYPMPVAETASTFNENLIVSRAIEEAESPEEKLALLEGQISDANQIICDIYSRYLFESSVFENRGQEFMGPDRLCELMHNAQLKAFGDGIDPDTLHPYMWLCKSHYYSGSLSFYNYPYAFGGLFAIGLYAIYQKQGSAFFPAYKEMLRATSIADCEDCAKLMGIDLTDKAFWAAGLQVLSDKIDEFKALVENN